MTHKWEYRIEYLTHSRTEDDGRSFVKRNFNQKVPGTNVKYGQQDLIEMLNELGNDGWEVVSIGDRLLNCDGIDGYVLLKREKN